MYISSGGTANSTIINSGGLHIFNGGIAKSIELNSCGTVYVSKGGSADSINFNSGGTLYVYAGGMATNINWTPCDGVIVAYKGGVVTYASNYSGCYLGEYGRLLSQGNSMSGVVIGEYGSMYIFCGGTATETTINSSGIMHVSSGGIVNCVNIDNYDARLIVSSGGTATNITANNGWIDFAVASDTYCAGHRKCQ